MNLLELLDAQYNEIWTRLNGIQRDIQMAYYDGLRDMYERFSGLKVGIDPEGKHYILTDVDMVAT